LGYRLELNYYNGKENSDSIAIFVPSFDGKTGYYQVPSNLVISEITLYDSVTATLDYNLTYKIDYFNENIPNFYSKEENLVGQVNDYWSFGTNISSYINEKYKVYNYEENNSTSDEITYKYTEGLKY
jgi:hypothetical protein